MAISRLRKRSVQLTREVLIELKQVMLIVANQDKLKEGGMETDVTFQIRGTKYFGPFDGSFS